MLEMDRDASSNPPPSSSSLSPPSQASGYLYAQASLPPPSQAALPQPIPRQAYFESDVPLGWQGDEADVEKSAFVIPQGPWANVDDAISIFNRAAELSSHRFKCCYFTSGHTSKAGSFKDWATVYCCCPKPPAPDASKPHAKSYCPFLVKLRLDKGKGLWDVYGNPNLLHTCQPLPDYSVTATGMRMLRAFSELTQDEVKFIHDQFQFVGVAPRLIQWNFTLAFPHRKPDSTLISRMRQNFQEKMFGFEADAVQRLMDDLSIMKEKGGVGHVECDSMMQISRLIIVRPDMMPFLNQYKRVLICDSTHGITMKGFKLYTIVVVDSLMHSAMAAYAFVKQESTEDLISVFSEIKSHLGADTVLISDDNPATSVLCHHFKFVHLLCQWHYAKSWVKNCTQNRMTRTNMLSFADVFYSLLRGTSFANEQDFEIQMRAFGESVNQFCPGMKTWINDFSRDRKQVCEYFRKGLFTAG